MKVIHMKNAIADYKKAVETIRNGDQALLEALIVQFMPLFKKYSYYLQDEDACSEYILTFIEIVLNANFDGFNDKDYNHQFLAYVARAIRNKYVCLSKKKQTNENKVIPLENAYNITLEESAYDDVAFFEMVKILNRQQAEIIILIYYWGYSAAEVARMKKMSRQAVNQCKQRALKILRNNIKKRKH